MTGNTARTFRDIEHESSRSLVKTVKAAQENKHRKRPLRVEWECRNTIHREGSSVMWQHRAGREQGQGIANLLQSFMQSFTGPLEQWLDRQIDRRLVRTFFLTLAAIVRLRHPRPGLLLSELGAHILSPGQAPAGTKGISNPLRSPRRSHTLLERFLWRRADRALSHLEGLGETALAIWDGSVLEKPESIAPEGLCPVDSSKAARLKRVKPGYYPPPGRPPVFVPGLQWLTVMAAGMQGPASLAAMGWWTSRGKLASHRREETASPLSRCFAGWQRRVVHVFDRGLAGAPWLTELMGHQVRFIMRWPTRCHLAGARGQRPVWQITRGKRSQDHRQTWDFNRRQYRRTGIAAVPVRHPRFDNEPWLVVSRPGRGRTPWRLLASETVATTDDAWRVVMAYSRRWQVEMCCRACRTDRAMEKPPALVPGKPAQAVADGQAGPCLPALIAGAGPSLYLIPSSNSG